VSPEVQRTVAPYLQIASAIRRDIMAGKLMPGDLVLSERDLSEVWKVSRMTASKALGSLRSAGLIHSEQGRGTFVSEVPEVTAADRYGRSVNPVGKSYGPNETSEIRSINIVVPPAEVASALNLDSTDLTIRRYRIISDSEQVTELTTAWFPASLEKSCPDLLKFERLPYGMLRYIKSMTGRVAEESCDVYVAAVLTDAELVDLGVTVPGPLASLQANHQILDTNGKPLVYIQAVYRPDYTLSQSVSLS
jgi:DNA-binding GntR family transcriptional regulator